MQREACAPARRKRSGSLPGSPGPYRASAWPFDRTYAPPARPNRAGPKHLGAAPLDGDLLPRLYGGWAAGDRQQPGRAKRRRRRQEGSDGRIQARGTARLHALRWRQRCAAAACRGTHSNIALPKMPCFDLAEPQERWRLVGKQGDECPTVRRNACGGKGTYIPS